MKKQYIRNVILHVAFLALVFITVVYYLLKFPFYFLYDCTHAMVLLSYIAKYHLCASL